MKKKLQISISGFEAYNKKLMYGVDVISVLNKAIDSNEKNKKAIENGETELYVDIAVTIKKTIGTRDEQYTLDESTGKYDVKNVQRTGVNEFKAGRTYKLSTDQAMFENLLISKIAFSDTENGIEYNGNDTSEKISSTANGYVIRYYPAAEFRRSTFVCKNIQYSKETGKVIGMTFEQYIKE